MVSGMAINGRLTAGQGGRSPLGAEQSAMKFRFFFWLCLVLLTPGYAQHHHHKNHDFSDIDRWVERFEDPARADWQRPDEVVESLGLRPGQNVADIGAGTGYFTRRLARRVSPGGFALAVDVEPGFFPYVNKRAREDGQFNILTVQADYENPRLEENSLDLIFICDTLHHIENRASYYQHLKKALRPGGRVVVVDFFKDKKIPVGPGPAMRLSAASVKAELESAGFAVSVDRVTLPYQYILDAQLVGTAR